MIFPRLSTPSRSAIGVAVAAWTGAALGRGPGLGGLLPMLGLAIIGRRRRTLLVLAAVGAAAVLSGMLSVARTDATRRAPIPEGAATVAGRLLSDPRPDRTGEHFALRPTHLGVGDGWRPWRGPRLLVSWAGPTPAVAGERVVVEGTLRKSKASVGGDPVAGLLVARVVRRIGGPSDPLFGVGNALRRRVQSGLAVPEPRPAAALLAGFLIGDIADLGAADIDALRRSGLSHFVAVSGSNVALFLAGWWLAAGPLARGRHRRAVVGLAGLAVFVVVTRWEPSVVRAAVMVALVLGGRLAGVPIDPWVALGGAVSLLVLLSADLTGDVGFQLSVAATAGVMAGAGLFAGRRPRWAWGALGATLAAQAAVTPLLLAHFGTIPLLSPVANLVAAPLVVGATTAGGVGVMAGFAPLTLLGVALARGVLGVARIAASWPQLGWSGAGAAVATGVLGLRPRLRPVMAVVASAVVWWSVVASGGPPGVPTAVFLDVGQGDAGLLLGPRGETVLIDGGPDRAVLAAALRRHGVRKVDLMIVSHSHADHVTGLLEVVETLAVGRIWYSSHPDQGDVLPRLLASAEARGVPSEVPDPGWKAVLGPFTLEVVGPLRRYASPNDGSLVVRVVAAGTTVLFSGDIEAFAQTDLGPLPADIMKVPHQGSTTSDLGWLRASAGEVAVISVGPNTFGHPAPEVVDALEGAGAMVRRTDDHGDVVVRLGAP